MGNPIHQLSTNNIYDLIIGKIAFDKELTVENAKKSVGKASEIMGLIAQLSDEQITLIRQKSWPE